MLGATGADISSGQWAGSGFTWSSVSSGRTDCLGSDWGPATVPGPSAWANQGRLQSCTAAASWWISQSSPDRPASLVNPTGEDPFLHSALGSFALQIHVTYVTNSIR